MTPGRSILTLACCLSSVILLSAGNKQTGDGAAVRRLADSWRAEHRFIDLHQHIDCTPEHLARAVQIMDRAGIGIEVNLSGGTTLHEEGQPSQFERNRQLADKLFPGRFLHYVNLDYSGWDRPD